MKPTIQHRYKLYRQTLLGKVTSDQFMEVFETSKKSEDKQNRYSGSFVENEKWWIACITKVESSTRYSDINYNDVAFGTTLYMHKHKDMVVAKVSLITYGQWQNRSNVINNVFLRMLKTLGYDQVEFEREEKQFARWATKTVKILIPTDKIDDDLIELIQSIEKYNNFVRDNESQMDTWDDLPRLLKSVKNLIRPDNNIMEAV